MDADLAVAIKREQREYAERPVPEEAVRRSLDAGRVAGSAKNRQPWRFLVLGDRGLVDQVAQTVYAPPDLLGAPAADRNCGERQGPVAFDAGRAAQNMVLAAWNEGVVSCPNGIANPESLAELLGLKADEQGYGTCSRRPSGARAGPRSAPTRGVSAEAVREAASLLESLGQQVQEIAIEVEEGYADNFIKVWIAQTGDEVHTYERLCGRQLDVDQLEPLSREMYALSSQINAPTTWARSTGCAATRGG